MAREKKEDGAGSARQLESGKWECVVQAKYLNPDTGKPKRIKRSGKTEEEATQKAQMARDAWEKAYEAGKNVKVSKTKTFGSYMDDYLREVCKPGLTASGYYSYRSAIRSNLDTQPIAKLQLQMLNAKEFETYYNKILSMKSKKTCSIPIQLCRRCCQWLVDRSLLKENYAAQAGYDREVADEYDHKKEADIKGRKKVFTPEDIQKFYYAYKNQMGQYPVVVLFLLETGMRIGEFAALRNDYIDIENRRIDIVATRSLRYKDNDEDSGHVEEYVKVPKNKESRFVYMSDLCVECVEYMQAQTKLRCKNNPDNLLYPTFINGKMRSSDSMEVCFKDLCDKLEIDRDVHLTKTGQKKGLCLHSLRHTADTIANTAAGANVVNTALAMGHKAISVENIYTHATPEALKSVVTPSQAVLDDYKRGDQEGSTDKEKELYALYKKLHQKFGDLG